MQWAEPLAVGSSWKEVTKFMGRDMAVTFEVTVLDPDRYLAMKMDGGSVSGQTTWDSGNRLGVCAKIPNIDIAAGDTYDKHRG